MLEAPVVFGRRRSCDIVLASALVSRHHAEVAYEGRRLVLRDLGSTDGTQVDGAVIDRPWPMAPGQEVRIGPYAIELLAAS